jgi:NADH dehydrogenase
MINDLITVFGASGFVGRHTVRALAKQGWRVRAVSRRPNLANYLLPAGHVGQIQIVKGNVNDEESVVRAIAGAGAVVNLTGVLFGHGEQNFDHVHAGGARRIGAAARAAGVEALVHISAIGADPEALSSYAQSKGCGERNLREEFAEATILRPSLVFGPEDKFFNKFASLARISPALPLIGGGHTRFQPVYVSDIAEAVVRTLSSPEARGQTYELGGPSVYTFKDLLQYILRETGRRRLLVPLPFALASLKAFFLQMPSFLLPVPPLLTMDQVTLLRTDNVVREGAKNIADLGFKPTTMESIVPGYLWRFRPKGQFDRSPSGSTA